MLANESSIFSRGEANINNNNFTNICDDNNREVNSRHDTFSFTNRSDVDSNKINESEIDIKFTVL